MNHTKNKYSNYDSSRKSIYVVACITIVSSFALWTGLLAKYSEYTLDVTSMLLPPLPYFDYAKYTTEEVAVAPVSISNKDISNPFTISASTEKFQELHEAAFVPPKIVDVTSRFIEKRKSFDPLSTQGISNKIVDSPNRNSLRQWELKSAYTLSIPKIGVYTNVLLPSTRNWNAKDWVALEQQMQVGLNNGAVAYPHSPVPGSKGTLIIAGHSSPPTSQSRASGYGDLFARIPELEYGDTFSITRGDGTKITYRLESTEVVSPSDTSILRQQQDKELLKLITCYPVGTTRERWIVTAKQVK